MSLIKKPVALIILDGFGIAPPSDYNAISIAKKPFFDSLLQSYPSHLLKASGMSVGLPEGEVGNSEVGHTSIGSGILQYQSLPRIDKSISTGQFFKIPELEKAIKKLKENKKTKLHLMGLIGNGGVHSSSEHLEALINLAKVSKIKNQVCVHAFLDGRDTDRDAGLDFVKSLEKYLKKQKTGEIASISGRYFAMDRNHNWGRIEKAYKAIVEGQSVQKYRDPEKAIRDSYNKKIYDEEFEPVVITSRMGRPIGTVDDGDVVVFFNFRADRARQISHALVDENFDKFKRNKQNIDLITFTEYEKNIPAQVLFSPEIIKNPIAKVFSDFNLKQLHIAETEKYAHVTFFLNGTQEEAFSGEDRILIPSPAVTSYDEKPEMSANEVTKNLLKAIKKDSYDFYAINYANPDMVGHTGNISATARAIEAVDKSIAQIIPEIIKKDGLVFVLADHGNAEELKNPITGEIDKKHNNYPVPFIMIDKNLAGKPNRDMQKKNYHLVDPVGILADVSPTILSQSGLDIPREMTGINLF